MKDWNSVLKSDPTGWLLEEDNPSVRYYTLLEIMDGPPGALEVIKARKEIMKKGVIPKILAKQEEEGYWGKPDGFYLSKYKGTVWQLIILAELGADSNDKRIRKAVEFILENSQGRQSFGFSMNRSIKTGGGRNREVLPCLTGNMVWSMIKFGYLTDHRIKKAIEWIVKYQRFDDGTEDIPKGYPWDQHEPCWGRHSCHMGVVKTLKALAEIPVNERSADVKKKISDGVEYLMAHNIYKRSHNIERVSKPGWLKFGFPLMYTTDALEILGILARLGYWDNRMRETLNLVISKQDDKGRWLLENTFNGRFQTNIEQKGKPSKWITLNALRVLKRFYHYI